MHVGLTWLDFKLGFRLLRKYPMLTVVGGLAMAVAITVGAATFEVINRVIDPTLPLPDGDRIVGLHYWDRAGAGQRLPASNDFLRWRDGLRTIEHVGAFRSVQRNLIVGGEAGDPVAAAEISAAAFRVAHIPPQLGRTLVEADEDLRAPAVMVLGHRLWQTRFGGDPGVLGRVVRLGRTQATVVGVMPEGFAFPVHHNLWIPLRPGELPRDAGGRVALRTFGQLAPGVTLTEAQAELTAWAAHAAAEFPALYENLQPQVLPYAQSFIPMRSDLLFRAGIHSINGFAVLFLLVVCGNVALLMFARAATREREILVRRALGAVRSRIVMQLFAEALVLGGIAALLGLTVAHFGLKWGLDALNTESNDWPFWFQGGLSPTTVSYAAILAALAAAVAGVVPALKVTSTGLEHGLRAASAGAGGLRMSGVWTFVMIAQITATVLFTAMAYVVRQQAAGIASIKAAFPAEQFLAVRLEMDGDVPTEANAGRTREVPEQYDAVVRELERRVLEDSRVVGVTLATRLPFMPQDGGMIEIEGLGVDDSSRREAFVTATAVDVDFFEAFQAPILSGRGFAPHDAGSSANTVVVNRLFVDRILAGRNAVGRRIRYKTEDAQSAGSASPWFEIVGVVGNLVLESDAPLSGDNPANPLVYHTLGSQPVESYPLYLAANVRGDARVLVPTLRRHAADISPTLRLSEVKRLDEASSSDASAWNAFARAILLVSATVLLLSLAAIYSVTSFAVSRRTREIAVRLALGAPALRIIANVFLRPVSHVAAGVATGCLMIGALVAISLSDSAPSTGTLMRHATVLVAYGTAMMGVCAIACIGPVLRLFRVAPTDVLREEA